MIGRPEKPFPRDPLTGIIRGAEPFAFGHGEHAVLLLHGWTSTPREMRGLGEALAEKGFACAGPLLPGHGTTLRALERTDFRVLLTAAENAFAALAANHSKVSVIGLSGGGLLALHLALRRRCENLALLAPYLRPAGKLLGIPKHVWLRLLRPPVRLWPKSEAGPILDPEAARDHIAYHAMPMPGILGLMRAADAVWERAGSLFNPTLILHATADATSDFSASCHLLQSLGSEDKRLVALSRSNHILPLDKDRDRVKTEILDFLEARR